MGWWFRREGRAKRMLRERERERTLLWDLGGKRERESLNLIRGEKEGERAVGMCVFKYINFGFFTKLKLKLACFLFLFLIPHLSVLQNSSPLIFLQILPFFL